MLQFVVFATLLAIANAGLLASPQLQYSAPLAYAAPVKTYAAPIAKIATPVLTKTLVQEEYAPAQYNFGYDVQDGLTGDNKEQHEQRDGDIVTGRYALNDPDGYRRIVEYTSDPIHGFNAVVRREPLGAPVVTKVATPVIAKVATPVAYAPALHAAPLATPLITKTLATPISYQAPAPLAYQAPAPLTYAAPAPLAYQAPIAKLAYPAPTTYIH